MPRFSVKVLPFVRVYAGGGGGGVIAVIVAIVVVVAIVAAVLIGGLSLIGHPLGLTPSWHEVMNRNDEWVDVNYPAVVARYLLTGVLLMAVLLLVASALAGDRPAPAVVPAVSAGPEADATSELADGRRWVPVISSHCPNCGTDDERPGGVFLCPKCGTQIPPEAHTATGESVLER